MFWINKTQISIDNNKINLTLIKERDMVVQSFKQEILPFLSQLQFQDYLQQSLDNIIKAFEYVESIDQVPIEEKDICLAIEKILTDQQSKKLIRRAFSLDETEVDNGADEGDVLLF